MEEPASRARRVDALFAEALEREPAARERFLEQACGGDRALRAEVELLIALAGRDAPGLEAGPAAYRGLWEELDGGPGEAAGPLASERIGPWRLVEELGRGGMATVFRAERADGGFDQTAALKLIRPGLGSEEILRRFELERQILASLSHTHIARLLDGGRAGDGRPYFVMEQVDGRPIDRYCDEQRLSVEERLDLFLQVARAVEHAHRNLVVHRDLKPSNIVVTADGEVKLLDFGIAKLLASPGAGAGGEPFTRPTSRLLTPEYASPEQMRGEAITTASDIYQLGLLLYELLTGHRAQEASGSAAELERAVCEVEPIRPSTRVGPADSDPAVFAARRVTPAGLRRRLRGDLDNIVLRALRKDPERRYAAVGELADDIERHRSGLPVRARPETVGYRARKFAARHRIGIAAGLVVAAAVIWAVAAVAGQQVRAAREAERAAQIEEIVGDLLAWPYPSTVDHPPEARDFVDHASGLILTELRGQPQSQARLLTLAGRVYTSLGLYESSIGVLERALEIRSRLYGEDSLEVAETLEAIAQSQHYASRYRAAEANLRRALTLRTERLGDDHPKTLDAALELADLLHTRGELGEAEALLRPSIRALRGPGGDHAPLARALRDLGNVLRDRGAVADSDASYRESIRLLREVHGDAAQPVAVAEVYYARLLIFRGELAAAEELLTPNLVKLRAIYDGDHPLTGTALRNLGYLRTEQGRYDEAEALLEEAESVLREWLGSEHAMVARAKTQQAELALRRGRYEAAQRDARSALDRFRRLEIAEHPMALDARRTLGRALVELGSPAAAADALADCLAVEERLYVAGDPRVTATRAALAQARAAPRASRSSPIHSTPPRPAPFGTRC